MIKQHGTKFSTPNIIFFVKNNYVIKISAKVNDTCTKTGSANTQCTSNISLGKDTSGNLYL